MANGEVGYGRLTELTSGEQSDKFWTTSRQSANGPNLRGVYCNYPINLLITLKYHQFSHEQPIMNVIIGLNSTCENKHCQWWNTFFVYKFKSNFKKKTHFGYRPIRCLVKIMEKLNHSFVYKFKNNFKKSSTKCFQ